MVFYHLIQFGKHVGSHHDERSNTEEEERIICSRIVEKAQTLVTEGKMTEGAFEVQICDEEGNDIDSFISGTDYKY